MTDILGISACYHDSAAAILRDGQILAAAQQERFSRRKHDASFPAQAIEYCLTEAQTDLATVKNIVFYDKPLIKFERLLETYESNIENRPGKSKHCLCTKHLDIAPNQKIKQIAVLA